MLTTEDGLLGGRLRYRQPETGFRSGIEPVLLAASVPAVPGERVLEAGTGAGAALLCLHARIAGLASAGVELDPDLAALAAANAAANGFDDMCVIAGDIRSLPLPDPFDHAIANPPYHPPGSASPLPVRERSKRGGEGLIGDWVARLASCLRPRGTLTFVMTAQAVPEAMHAFATAGCAATVLFPLWPKVGRDARLVLLRGVRGSRAPLRLAAGLVLHAADGGFTDAAQEILRRGRELPL